MPSSTSTVVSDCVVAMEAGITGATGAVPRSRETQASLPTSHAGAQCNLQGFEDTGCQTEASPATLTVVRDLVITMPTGVTSTCEAVSCSRKTQATVSVSHTGAQCDLQCFEDMGCQTDEDFLGVALNPFHLSSQQEAPCAVHAHKCCPLPSTKGSTNDHQESWINEGPYVGQSCEQQSHDRAYEIALKDKLCGQLPYVCPICKEVFIQKNFTAHMMVHAVRKSYSCQFCQKAYTDSRALLVHEKRHTGGKPFICSNCDRGFSTKAFLEMHERLHAVSKPFGCQFCSQTFTSQDGLSLHLRLHNTARLFFCTFCQKGWPTQKALAIHESWHAREEPNVCDVCERRFSRQADLRRHMQLHRGNLHFTCDTCHRAFKDKNRLLKHLRGRTHAELYAKKFSAKKQSNEDQM